jgi:hypothetical protein
LCQKDRNRKLNQAHAQKEDGRKAKRPGGQQRLTRTCMAKEPDPNVQDEQPKGCDGHSAQQEGSRGATGSKNCCSEKGDGESQQAEGDNRHHTAKDTAHGCCQWLEQEVGHRAA